MQATNSAAAGVMVVMVVIVVIVVAVVAGAAVVVAFVGHDNTQRLCTPVPELNMHCICGLYVFLSLYYS